MGHPEQVQDNPMIIILYDKFCIGSQNLSSKSCNALVLFLNVLQYNSWFGVVSFIDSSICPTSLDTSMCTVCLRPLHTIISSSSPLLLNLFLALLLFRPTKCPLQELEILHANSRGYFALFSEIKCFYWGIQKHFLYRKTRQGKLAPLMLSPLQKPLLC